MACSNFIEHSKNITANHFDLDLAESVQLYGEIESLVSNIVLHYIGSGYYTSDLIISHTDTFLISNS